MRSDGCRPTNRAAARSATAVRSSWSAAGTIHKAAGTASPAGSSARTWRDEGPGQLTAIGSRPHDVRRVQASANWERQVSAAGRRSGASSPTDQRRTTPPRRPVAIAANKLSGSLCTNTASGRNAATMPRALLMRANAPCPAMPRTDRRGKVASTDRSSALRLRQATVTMSPRAASSAPSVISTRAPDVHDAAVVSTRTRTDQSLPRLNCRACRRAYAPLRTSRSACVPCSTSCPRSRTRIRSAC